MLTSAYKLKHYGWEKSRPQLPAYPVQVFETFVVKGAALCQHKHKIIVY